MSRLASASTSNSASVSSIFSSTTSRPRPRLNWSTNQRSTSRSRSALATMTIVERCPFRNQISSSFRSSSSQNSIPSSNSSNLPTTNDLRSVSSLTSWSPRTSKPNHRFLQSRSFSKSSKSNSPASPTPASLASSAPSIAQSYYSHGLGTTHLSNEILMRVTVLDSKGTVKLSQGTFKKSELCSEHGLEPRDLRKIDSRVPNLVPTILARRSGFLINILHIRALVKADTVLLFDSYGAADTHLNSAFLYNLEHNLRHSSPTSLPYEFRALESILASVLDALRSELFLLRDLVSSLLETLDADIDREKLRLLLQYSRKLSGYLGRSRGVKNAVVEVLDDDEDMAAMYLSETKSGTPRGTNSHDELELLLESFDKQVEEVLAETENMAGNIQTTQEVVELILDSNRNQLLTLDLKTSIATLGVSVGTLWVGFFGQNLLSGLEENSHAFWGSSGFAVVLVLILASRGMRHLSSLRRIGLGINSINPKLGWIESWRRRRSGRRSSPSGTGIGTGVGIGGLDIRATEPGNRKGNPLAEDLHETSMQRWRRALISDYWEKSSKNGFGPPPWWGTPNSSDGKLQGRTKDLGHQSPEELRNLFRDQSSEAMGDAAGLGGKYQKKKKVPGNGNPSNTDS